LTNSPKKKLAGYEAPGRLATDFKRKANKRFGKVHTAPPNAAEIAPRVPANKPNTSVAIIVAPSCKRMALNIRALQKKLRFAVSYLVYYKIL